MGFSPVYLKSDAFSPCWFGGSLHEQRQPSHMGDLVRPVGTARAHKAERRACLACALHSTRRGCRQMSLPLGRTMSTVDTVCMMERGWRSPGTAIGHGRPMADSGAPFAAYLAFRQLTESELRRTSVISLVRSPRIEHRKGPSHFPPHPRVSAGAAGPGRTQGVHWHPPRASCAAPTASYIGYT